MRNQQRSSSFFSSILVAATVWGCGLLACQAAPVVTTLSPSPAGDISATLRGSVNASGHSLTLRFEYGLTIQYGYSLGATPSSIAGTNMTAVSADITHLSPGTRYHYRLIARDTAGVEYPGADVLFETMQPSTPPSVTGTPSFIQVGARNAYIQGVNVLAGGSPAAMDIEYGTTTAYGSSASIETYASLLWAGESAQLGYTLVKGLAAGALLHVRVRVRSATGTAYSADAVLQTNPSPQPVTLPATQVGDTAALLHGSFSGGSEQMSVFFECGRSTAYGQRLSAGRSGNLASTLQDPFEPATTYHYRLVAQYSHDEVYYGGDQTFTTTAASTVPRYATNAPIMATSVKAGSAIISVHQAASGGAPAVLTIEYGTTTAYGSVVQHPQSLAISGTSISRIDVPIRGLAPNTAYHCRASLTSTLGSALSPDIVFTTLPAPAVFTSFASGSTDVYAFFNGSTLPAGGSYSAFFDFGTTPACESTRAGHPASASGTVLANLSLLAVELLPSTTYYYRLRLHDGDSSYSGAVMSMTTPPASSPPFIAVETVVNHATTSSAVISAYVNAGGAPAQTHIEYGPTTAYGSQVALPALETSREKMLSKQLTGLQNNTLYHYRVVAVNVFGTSFGEDATFTTLPTPLMQAGTAESLTGTTAQLSAVVNTHGLQSRVRFEYGLTDAYGLSAEPGLEGSPFVTGSSDSYINTRLTQLQPGAEYHFRTRLENENGIFWSPDATFTTPNVMTATFQNELYTSVGARVVRLSASVTAGNSPTSVVVEYGTSRAYGMEEPFPLVLSPRDRRNCEVTLRGLQPATLYYYKVKATSIEGTVEGPESSFITRPLPALTTLAATEVTETSAVLHGSISQGDAGTYYLRFTDSRDVLEVSDYPDGSLTSNPDTMHSSYRLKGLTPGMTYHYRIAANSGDALEAFVGAEMSFTTAPASMPPSGVTGAVSNITATTATVFAENLSAGSANATLTWEYGTSTAYGMETTEGTLLTPHNYTRSSSIGLTGLLPSSTYHYRAKFHSVLGTTFGGDRSFTTESASLEAETGRVTRITPRSATLNGSGLCNAGVSTLLFEWGTTNAYGSSLPATPGSQIASANPFTATAALNNLTPGTLYHYRFVNQNIAGTIHGADRAFTTPPGGAPLAITGTALGSSDGHVTFHGSAEAGSATTMLYFEYGVDESYGAMVSASPAQIAAGDTAHVRAVAGGFAPEEWVHYRLVAVSTQGMSRGENAQIRLISPPAIVTRFPCFLREHGAELAGWMHFAWPQESWYPSQSWFEYGLNSSYGSKVVDHGYGHFFGWGGSNFSLGIGSMDWYSSDWPRPQLQPSTTYHYRMVSSNEGGTVYGDDISFTTLPAQQAIVPVASQLTSSSTRLSVLVPADMRSQSTGFYFGEAPVHTAQEFRNTSPGWVESSTAATPVNMDLANLKSGTTYYYNFVQRWFGSDGSTHSNSGGTFRFTTLTHLENWRRIHFGSTTGSGSAADLADKDHDGLSNLIEWACALDPTDFSTSPTILSASTATIEFTYRRDTAALGAGAVFSVEWSDSLSGNSWSNAGVSESIVLESSGIQQVKAILPRGGGDRRFVRLRVNAP